ncbi:MAG: hypothetical protein HC925_06515 [Coleofasciculaceae cyanobacterium SM2_3_26]|nr:hypothetical protein [Coleofasciculaceae cyanobacterium SM2_3_26]
MKRIKNIGIAGGLLLPLTLGFSEIAGAIEPQGQPCIKMSSTSPSGKPPTSASGGASRRGGRATSPNP